MIIKKGDIYWVKHESNIPHPYIIIQDMELNNTKSTKVTVCRVTTNRRKLDMPGIVILEKGEGGLEKESIVESYNILTIERVDLGEYIGTLSRHRVNQILAGIRLVEQSFLNQ